MHTSPPRILRVLGTLLLMPVFPTTFWTQPSPLSTPPWQHPTITVDSLLDSILHAHFSMMKTTIPLVVHERVRYWVRFYAIHHRQWFEQYLAQFCALEPVIQDAIRQTNLPEELKYIVIVESGGKLNAVSRSGAVGPWQFIASTARLYNLKVSTWIDERRDIYLSTRAALAFFTDLYNKYRDWYLALASYNCGPGRVAWALRRAHLPNPTTDSLRWDSLTRQLGPKLFEQLLPYLPTETRNYVYRFLAVLYLAEFAAWWEFRPDTHQVKYWVYPPDQTDTLHVHGPLSLAQIAYFTGVPFREIAALNAAWRTGKLPSSRIHYTLRLPCSAAQRLRQWRQSTPLTQLPQPPKTYLAIQTQYFPRIVYHRVRKGETLSHIARRYGVTVRQLQQWNGIRGHIIYPGQRIAIYIQ